ncbi:heparin-binding hemagglutinin [Nocardia otitidiscaviarum]|uniref:Heparin-binding hemagglutinin n=1 Tax=Nocardia otitidiscaviarum TaxID=1823 RepID=A0A516NVS0_9NOCA|nr:heparin-binding hemagglutinin [Nocardia otitidiscaviarum]MBF6182939.1 heparin-binding hemagglutinin [Nocardia otitidiscaviarum]MCP9622501.1 heparin-binding hemagglutinin [Nocardia otitidiscaviarum]QDP83006.1 heparin-binding hemagglutinin [Nocardia otitidiscaviarum]
MTETKLPTAVAKPLYAGVGAGDTVYAQVKDIVEKVREQVAATDVSGRVEEARERFANLPADVQEQIETIRTRVSSLPSELPDDLAELREKLTAEELRRLADQYYHQVLDLYADLAARGEETVERLRANPTFEERFEQVESFYSDLVTRTEDVLGKVQDQVGPLLGRAAEQAEEIEETVEAEVVKVTDEPAETPAAKKAPAKKAPAKKAPAKKATPAAKK